MKDFTRASMSKIRMHKETTFIGLSMAYDKCIDVS